MQKKIIFTLLFITILSVLIFGYNKNQPSQSAQKSPTWWPVQSIDTMKYSRDLSAEKLTDASFDAIIDEQIHNIAKTGATHVGIATPYDERFIPILTRWVNAARKYNLHVWFRGNFSGWEGWFGFSKISRDEHVRLTKDFIITHKNLFEDGDYFTACPECENGGNGDPRMNGDAEGHRLFLIREFNVATEAFASINKRVSPALHSMNYDVAKLIMDKPTTRALGGIVAIDHYVQSPIKLAKDVREIAEYSGGSVFLGEFGVPIPDIHGKLSDEQQAIWIQDALNELISEPSLIGLNYWVNVGGSTELWSNQGSKPAVTTLTSFYTPRVIEGKVTDQNNKPIANAKIKSAHRNTVSDATGRFKLPIHSSDNTLYITSSINNEIKTQIDQDTTQVKIIIRNPNNSWFKSLMDRIINLAN